MQPGEEMQPPVTVLRKLKSIFLMSLLNFYKKMLNPFDSSLNNHIRNFEFFIEEVIK